jgi:hypothetical protein
MMTQDQFMQSDSDGQAEFIAILRSVAAGEAPSLSLRTCALRALRNEPVSGPLSSIKPTDEERFELAVMAEVAAREVRRH